jgi:hypothetical protein
VCVSVSVCVLPETTDVMTVQALALCWLHVLLPFDTGLAWIHVLTHLLVTCPCMPTNPLSVPGNPGDYSLRLQQWTREKEIAEATWKIKQEELQECHRVNGENHYEQCTEIAKEVMDMFRKPHFGALELVEKGTIDRADLPDRHTGKYFK